MDSGYYIQVLISFTVLGALLFGLYKMLQFYKTKTFSGDIKIKDRVSLDSVSSVCVVEYKDSEFLILNGQILLILQIKI